MANNMKTEKELKICALHDAIEELRESSTPSSNKMIFKNVCDRANEICAGKTKTKISITSIKTPSSEEFEIIKDLIEEHRKDHKKIKNAISSESKKETTSLKETIDNLMIEVAKFYDNKLMLNELLESKENTIIKLKKERNVYIEELDRLEGCCNGN